MLISCLLAGLAPVGVTLAAVVTRTPVRSSLPASTCGSPHLAAPRYQGPDTVDYFVEQNVVTPTATVHVHLGAYAAPNTGAPRVAVFRVLDSRYNTLTRPLDSGMWHVTSEPCYPDPDNPRPIAGGRSDLYYFEGTWTAPAVPGPYELAVTVVFADGTVVDYLINMFVVGPGVPRPPRFNSYARDTLDLHGLGDTLQNTANNAYNLAAIPAQLDVVTTYYYQGNPAPRRGQSLMANAMLDPAVNRQDVFQNTRDGLQDDRLPLPLSGHTRPFTYQQQVIAAGGAIQTVMQTGAVTVEPYAMPAGVLSDQAYTDRVVVHEPVTVRRSDTEYLLKVGSYTVDNGFFGPVADGHGTVGLNFGDGQGVTFYANPGSALLDPTHRHCNGATTGTCIYWDAVNPSAVGEDTTVVYHLTLVNSDVPRGKEADIVTATTTAPWANVNASVPATYQAYVQAEFQIMDDDGKPAPSILSDSMASTITTEASTTVSTSTPVPMGTPTPLFTSTPAPTDTALPTDTPLPTETPTPHGEATAVQTTEAYAWLRTSSAEDAAAQDALIPTTRHTTDPAHFFWPVGRPLHVLPALSAHDEDTTLTLIDARTGARALLHPVSVQDTWYQVTGTDAACSSMPDRPVPYGASPSYPGEVDPTGSAPLTILWMPGGGSGGAPGGILAGMVRCDVSRVVGPDGPASIALTYTVQQRLTFALTFGLGTWNGSCTMVTPTPAPAAASSTQSNPLAPPPAFATPGLVPAGCDAGAIGLATAEDAFRRLRDIDGAPIVGRPLLRPGTDGRGHATLDVVLAVRRSLALHYTLLVRRDVD